MRVSAYVPPHRRGPEHAASQNYQRGLSEVDVPDYMEVKLEMTPNGPFNLEECPVYMDGSQIPVILYVPHTNDTDIVHEVLRWFHSGSSLTTDEYPEGDTAASLSLPQSLRKEQRAMWHHIAREFQLGSASQGLGYERYLKIFTTSMKTQGTCSLNMTDEQWAKVTKIWKWCQMEKGKFSDISKFEIGEMLLSDAGLSEEIHSLMQKMEQAAKLCRCLRLGDQPGAAELLTENWELSWTRDEISGGYPIHLATWQGITGLVSWLAQIDGMIDVKDASYATALNVARARNHDDIVEILLSNGASDNGCDDDERLGYLHRPSYNSFKSDEGRDVFLYGKSKSQSPGTVVRSREYAGRGRGRSDRGGRSGRGWRGERLERGGSRGADRNRGGRSEAGGWSARSGGRRGKFDRGGRAGQLGRGGRSERTMPVRKPVAALVPRAVRLNEVRKDENGEAVRNRAGDSKSKNGNSGSETDGGRNGRDGYWDYNEDFHRYEYVDCEGRWVWNQAADNYIRIGNSDEGVPMPAESVNGEFIASAGPNGGAAEVESVTSVRDEYPGCRWNYATQQWESTTKDDGGEDQKAKLASNQGQEGKGVASLNAQGAMYKGTYGRSGVQMAQQSYGGQHEGVAGQVPAGRVGVQSYAEENSTPQHGVCEGKMEVNGARSVSASANGVENEGKDAENTADSQSQWQCAWDVASGRWVSGGWAWNEGSQNWEERF